MGLTRSGTRVAIAHKLGNIVTIFDILAQSPPEFIDTNVELEGLALAGNVLLVAGSREIVAWLLTEEGLVDGIIGDRGVGRSDSIWLHQSKIHGYPGLGVKLGSSAVMDTPRTSTTQKLGGSRSYSTP